MGATRALDMAEAVEGGSVSLEVALLDHLLYNHYPPVNVVFVPTCIQAIQAIEDEEPELEIQMPNGLVRTAAFIVDGLHLEAFIS